MDSKEIELEQECDNKNHHIFELDGRRYHSEIVEITPKMAKSILDSDNFNNRPISKVNVKSLVREMTNGNWLFDGSPIRFNDKGQLMDGRHRLSAIVTSGKTFKFNILRGLDTETFKSMDTGRPRSVSDTFAISGIINSNTASSIVKFIFGFRNNIYSLNRSSTRTLSNTEILDYYDLLNEEGNIDNSVSFTKYLQSKSGLGNTTTFGGFHYLFSLINKDDADTFITKLCTGEMLERNSPINVLRNKLIKFKSDSEFRLTQLQLNAYMVMAWNRFRNGEKCKNLILPADTKDYDFNIL